MQYLIEYSILKNDKHYIILMRDMLHFIYFNFSCWTLLFGQNCSFCDIGNNETRNYGFALKTA